MASYFIKHPQIGVLSAEDVDTLAPGAVNLVGTNASGRWAALGDIVGGYHTTYGGCQFIYLKGASGIAAGELVQWDNTYTVVELASTANTGRPIALAITAVGASQYGWFAIQGKHLVLKTAVKISPDSRMWISGTAGRFFSTATTGKQILNARTVNSATVASTTSTVLCYLHFSGAQGQII